jgi:hypothetical protein
MSRARRRGGGKRQLKRVAARSVRRVSELDVRGFSLPIEVRVYLRAIERQRALEDGKEPPPYSREEIEAMHRWDLETVEGRGAKTQLRDTPGWQSEEARALLESWEEGARRRLAVTDGLPPERWGEVYEHDEDEELGGGGER